MKNMKNTRNKNIAVIVGGIVMLGVLGYFFLSGGLSGESGMFGDQSGSGIESSEDSATAKKTAQTDTQLQNETSGQKTEYITVTQKVQLPESANAATETVIVFEGSTALDALEKNHTVEKNGEGENAFVTSIDGVSASDEDKTFWSYYINGEYAQVGAGSYTLLEGDEIVWEFATY